MKVLNASQLSDLDQYSCKEQHISSWELMERAAGKAYEEIKIHLSSGAKKIKILAGPGNNGGDGLAIAYFLAEDAYDVDVYLVNFTPSRSEDNKKNLERLKEQSKCNIEEIDDTSNLPDFDSHDIIIDSIFGVGLNRPMPDFVQNLIKSVNEISPKTFAIDMPSGMYMDQSPSENEQVFKSDIVLTFQTPKFSFYLPDYSSFVGDVKIIDIGLSQDRLEQIFTKIVFVDLNYAKNLLKQRSKFSHKGTYGHAVIVGGSQLMLGSVLLSASSCMRSGVGKTSVMMPSRGHDALLQYLPEAMLINNKSEDFISYEDLDFQPDAVGIGIGIGKSKDAQKALETWLGNSTQPLVIDADALNLIAEHKDLLHQIPKKSILTPHPGELQRLVGSWKDDFEKLEKVKEFSKKHDIIVLAKDAYTLCVYRNEVFVNSTGNSGMATAGSGDVLTGLITGLLAQGYSSLNAAILGAFIHGFAGDFASKNSSEESLIASDLFNYFGYTFSKLKD